MGERRKKVIPHLVVASPLGIILLTSCMAAPFLLPIAFEFARNLIQTGLSNYGSKHRDNLSILVDRLASPYMQGLPPISAMSPGAPGQSAFLGQGAIPGQYGMGVQPGFPNQPNMLQQQYSGQPGASDPNNPYGGMPQAYPGSTPNPYEQQQMNPYGNAGGYQYGVQNPYGTPNPYGQPNPYGTAQYGQQSPYGTVQYGQANPYGTGQYGQQNPYGTVQYGQANPYGAGQYGQQNPYGTVQYGQPNPYGTAQYGQQSPYGTVQYGQPNPYGTGQYGQPNPYDPNQYGQQNQSGTTQYGQQNPYGTTGQYGQQNTYGGTAGSQQPYDPNNPYGQSANGQGYGQSGYSNAQGYGAAPAYGGGYGAGTMGQPYGMQPYSGGGYGNQPYGTGAVYGRGLSEPVAVDVAMIRQKRTERGKEIVLMNDGEVLKDGGANKEAGDRFKIVVRANCDCYIYITSIDGSGWVEPVFPSKESKVTNPVKKDEEYAFPETGHWYALDEIKGIESFFVVASVNRRLDLEESVSKLAGEKRPNVKIVAKVEEPPIIPRGVGSVRTKGILKVQDETGTAVQVTPLSYAATPPNQDVTVTRWFKHE